MIVAASVKKRCRGCKVIRRKGKVKIICDKEKRHKQTQG